MNYFIIANENVYDYHNAFKELIVVPWQQRTIITPGTIVYIYGTAPHKRLLYIAMVEENNLLFNEIVDDEHYWLDKVRYKKGITGFFMNLRFMKEIRDDLFTYQNLRQNGLGIIHNRHSIPANEKLANYLKPLKKELKGL